MVEIIYVTHAQTIDIVDNLATGWSDPDLTGVGINSSLSIGTLLEDRHFHAAYSSDHLRSLHTAELVLRGRNLSVNQDQRLRNINYGQYNGRPRAELFAIKRQFVNQPFPEGESFSDVVLRWRGFLGEIRRQHAGETVFICDSWVYPLEVIINGRDISDVLAQKVPTYQAFHLA